MSWRKPVTDKARAFGRTIRQLEDTDQWVARKTKRTLWRQWYKHLGKDQQAVAIDAYYDEYCREPLDDEYEGSDRGNQEAEA